VGKTAHEIQFALRSGVRMLNVESQAELRAIATVAQRLGVRARVALRVNPDVDPNTHEKTTTGRKENKFGLDVPTARRLAEESASMEQVELRGLHVHLGSPIYSPEPYRRALQVLASLLGELREKGLALDTVNLGGGFCISYTGEAVAEPVDYAAAVEDILEKTRCHVIIEPGRYIAGPSGVLLMRVIYRKETAHGKRFLICDGAMNDLLRPTLYGAFHRIWPVRSEAGMPAVMRPQEEDYPRAGRGGAGGFRRGRLRVHDEQQLQRAPPLGGGARGRRAATPGASPGKLRGVAGRREAREARRHLRHVLRATRLRRANTPCAGRA